MTMKMMTLELARIATPRVQFLLEIIQNDTYNLLIYNVLTPWSKGWCAAAEFRQSFEGFYIHIYICSKRKKQI